jgi:hypothetical protein
MACFIVLCGILCIRLTISISPTNVTYLFRNCLNGICKTTYCGQGMEDPRGLGSLVFIMGQTGLHENYTGGVLYELIGSPK